MNDTLIKVDGVSKKFCKSLKRSLWYGMQDLGRELTGRRHGGDGQLRQDEFWAVKDISFELKRGECLGLIGHNGAGKTTLLRLLNGLIRPDQGRIEMRGRVAALIALGAGFNPILSGRENIVVNASVLGLSKREIDAKLEEIIDFAEIRDFIDAPVQTYSSGMQVRLGFAVATSLEPDILILDEVLAVGDFAFHAKCYKRIGAMSRASAVIFVSHDQSSVGRICDRALFMDHGTCAFQGDTHAALRLYNRRARAGASEVGTVETHDDVGAFRIECGAGGTRAQLATADPLQLRLRLHLDQPLPVGKCLITFYSEAGTSAGQADFSGQLQVLPAGPVDLGVRLNRLDLAAGRYLVNVAMFHANGRDTLVHAISCAEITVDGPPFLGSAYKIPVAVELRRDAARVTEVAA